MIEITKKECPVCGKGLGSDAWHRRIYCSEECQRKAQRQRSNDARVPEPITPERAFSIVIAGEPSTKGRPRLGRGGKVFTPEGTKAAEEHIRWHLLSKGVQPDNRHELCVTLEFRIGNRQRKDLDNLIKLVLDACNGFAWYDDVQVVDLHASVKRGHPEPGITLTVDRVAQKRVHCSTCGAVIKKHNGGSMRFCSRACYDKDQRKGSTVECSSCGKEMYRQRSRAPKAITRFCSDDCRSRFLSGRPRPGGKWTRS